MTQAVVARKMGRRQVLVGCGLAALWPCAARAEGRDGARDFDFEFGSWTMRLRRRLKPLTGSDEWVEYEGSSVVHKL